jgi:hypothetical protein
VLHEGPVPGRLGFAQLREVRARFLAERSWGDPDRILADMAARDGALDAAGDCAELVLWFEHDLYDQLQLLQILHRLATQGPDPGRLTLACEPEYLGMLSTDRIRALHARRDAVTREQVALAMAAWAAFTAPESQRLVRLLEGDTAALPFLGAALRRHLEEFPSERTGLSRSEQQALEALAHGAASVGEAFRRSHHEREDAVFLGDTVFAWYLERMSDVPVPLVRFATGDTVHGPGAAEDRTAYWGRALALTDAGRAVLAGEENAIALNGLDRWLGGVPLEVPRGRPSVHGY